MDVSILFQILNAKRGMPSTFPSAFLQDEMFEEPFSMEEIKADPKKHILWAAENNQLELVKDLLNDDASLIGAYDEDKYTPLHRASYNDHLDMISLLLTHGADIHSKTADGWQPFHSACRWGNVNAAKLLISKGADVHCLTNGCNTALHLAACNGDAEAMIKFLLNHTNIDISVVNSGNDTAQQIAERNSSFGALFNSVKTASHTAQVECTESKDSTAQVECSESKDSTAQVECTESKDSSAQVECLESKDAIAQIECTKSRGATTEVECTDKMNSTAQGKCERHL